MHKKQAEFRDAIFRLKMPRETRIVWNEGEPPRPSRPRRKKKASIF
jgi:hypothetical protein